MTGGSDCCWGCCCYWCYWCEPLEILVLLMLLELEVTGVTAVTGVAGQWGYWGAAGGIWRVTEGLLVLLETGGNEATTVIENWGLLGRLLCYWGRPAVTGATGLTGARATVGSWRVRWGRCHDVRVSPMMSACPMSIPHRCLCPPRGYPCAP